MTPEEIIAMAKEASICHSADSYEFTHDGMLGFAALVAEKAAAKEREACAEIAEKEDVASTDDPFGVQSCIAGAIRARGQKEGA